MGLLAVQFGTLVKLVRVLMLGPVVLCLSLAGGTGRPLRVAGLVPWFILGFLALAGLRSSGMLPDGVRAPAALLANMLTLVAMAALGLSTDLRAVARSGARVGAVALVSLLGLGALGLALIRLAGVVIVPLAGPDLHRRLSARGHGCGSW